MWAASLRLFGLILFMSNLYLIESIQSSGCWISQRGKCCCMMAVSEWSLCLGVKMGIRSHYSRTSCLLNSKWPRTFPSPYSATQRQTRRQGRGQDKSAGCIQSINEVKRFSRRKVTMWSMLGCFPNKCLNHCLRPTAICCSTSWKILSSLVTFGTDLCMLLSWVIVWTLLYFLYSLQCGGRKDEPHPHPAFLLFELWCWHT